MERHIRVDVSEEELKLLDGDPSILIEKLIERKEPTSYNRYADNNLMREVSMKIYEFTINGKLVKISVEL